ncbi:flagellar basal body P-ring formation chaperone FlgA [Halomonas sp. WWR20]
MAQPSTRKGRKTLYLAGHIVALPLMALIAALSWAPIALASDQAVINAVEEFLYAQAEGEDISVEVRPSTARLPECANPEPFLPRSGPPQGRVTVGVQCGEQRRYMQATVAINTRHLVASRDIAPGTTVTRDMFEWHTADQSRLPRQWLDDPQTLIGAVTTRRIPAGTALQSSMVRERYLVRRGEPVTLVAQGAGFRITREAKALESGGMGTSIRVRTDDGNILHAQVSGESRLNVVF